jgi:glutaredoxin 3
VVDYRNVKKSPQDLAEMLRHSGGQRDVPVIVEGGRVTIGYGGS